VTQAALVEAAARARPTRASRVSAPVEALRVQAQALLLLEAIEVFEGQGAARLADVLDRLGSGEGAPPGERAVAASPALAEAARAARALAAAPSPKGEEVKRLLRDALRARPGARIVVVAKHQETARAVAGDVAAPPPSGLGVPVARVGGGGGRVLVATSAEAEGLDTAGADLVVYHERASTPPPGRRGARGATPPRPRREVVLVVRGGREESPGAAPPAHGVARGAVAAARARPARGSQRLIDEFAAPRAGRRAHGGSPP